MEVSGQLYFFQRHFLGIVFAADREQGRGGVLKLDFVSKHIQLQTVTAATGKKGCKHQYSRTPYQYCDEPQLYDLTSLDQLLTDCTVTPVKTAPAKTKQTTQCLFHNIYCTPHKSFTSEK